MNTTQVVSICSSENLLAVTEVREVFEKNGVVVECLMGDIAIQLINRWFCDHQEMSRAAEHLGG